MSHYAWAYALLGIFEVLILTFVRVWHDNYILKSQRKGKS